MMEFITHYLQFMTHLDKHIVDIVAITGHWTYLILFAIVFFECGIIFTPFLPGESMLFATGTISALGALNVHVVFCFLCVAAITGGFTNFALGHFLRDHLHRLEKIKFVQRFIKQAQDFYAKHGGKTIFIARLIPLIRTYAPFVAGVVHMNKKSFAMYNILGALCWISLFLYGGYFFGSIPVIKRNFSVVILAILIISIVPAILAIAKQSMPKKNMKSCMSNEG